jgi:hypothetical protein
MTGRTSCPYDSADDAANYTVDRLVVLRGELRSYTIQEDGIQ